MDELFSELQKTIDKLIDHYIGPHMGSSEFRQKLLFTAHVYGLGMAKEMNRELMFSMSRPIIIVTTEEQAEKLRKEIADAKDTGR
jgi:hypothetical protein